MIVCGDGDVRGRVGSLLEIGMGFSFELTGRENVYLNGLILGMTRHEVVRRFDEIVAFAGIESFIDTPVKRYSTGMEARLGFAIAAHLEPDVLLVDEVLAVGDAAFQVRAFAKITELVKREIPVVVVTHKLEVVPTLCTQAILLDRGRVVKNGTPQECITAYLHGQSNVEQTEGSAKGVRIESIRLSSPKIGSGELLHFALTCAAPDGGRPDAESVDLRIRLAETGAVAFETGTFPLGVSLPAEGKFQLTFELQMNLHPGVYRVETHVWDRVAGRESHSGPAAYLAISGAPFPGYAQCHPAVQLATPSVDGLLP